MPVPPLRVPPSGPLASGDFPPPLAELAGDVFVPNSTLVANSGYLSQIMGPPNATPDLRDPIFYTARSGGGVPAGANLVPLLGIAPLDGYGAGTWLVELELQVGFLNAPLSAANVGALRATIAALNDDGTAAAVINPTGANAHNDLSPLPYGGVDTPAGTASHTAKFLAPIVITPAMVTANGGLPLKTFSVQVERRSASADSQTYADTVSGNLNIGRNTVLTARRIR